MLQMTFMGSPWNLSRSAIRFIRRPPLRSFSETSRLRVDRLQKTPLTSGSSQNLTQSPLGPKVPHSLESPTSALSPGSGNSSPPPPPHATPPSPSKRFRRPRNIGLIFLFATLAYGGAVWYSFQSDNFHDFFTEYVPGSNYILHAIRDYQFRQRYPNTDMVRAGVRISDLGRKGPHISAIASKYPEGTEKEKLEEMETEETKKKRENQKQGKLNGNSGEEQMGPSIQVLSKTSTPPQTPSESVKQVEKEPQVKRDASGALIQADSSSHMVDGTKGGAKEAKTSRSLAEEKPVDTAASPPVEIDTLDISPNDASIEKVVKSLNDLITQSNSARGSDASFAQLYQFLKESVKEVNSRIPEIVSSLRAEAASQIQTQAQYFNQLHEEIKAAVIEEQNRMANEWAAAFDKERDALQQRYNERLSQELKKQSELNDAKLQSELLEQAISLRRRWLREIQSQVETERGGRLAHLAGLEKALTELQNLHQDSYAIVTKNEKVKKKGIAVQALKDAALNRNGAFVGEVAALKSIAGQDELVHATVASIDPEAYRNGVASQAELATEFQSLARQLRKIALLPNNAGVAGHAASWLLSKIMFRQKGYIKGDDMESRLARIEALLESGELEDATRELNSLNGWGRDVSRDWLRKARRRLEVIQAIEVLEAHTALEALESV